MAQSKNLLGLTLDMQPGDALLSESVPTEAPQGLEGVEAETGEVQQTLADDFFANLEFEALPPSEVPGEISDLEFFEND